MIVQSHCADDHKRFTHKRSVDDAFHQLKVGSQDSANNRSGMDVLLEALEYQAASSVNSDDNIDCEVALRKHARMSPEQDSGEESVDFMGSPQSPPPLLSCAIPPSPTHIPVFTQQNTPAGLGINNYTCSGIITAQPNAEDSQLQQPHNSLLPSGKSIKIRCWTPKLAIKSYGSEKRFLYPSPKIEFYAAADLSSLRSIGTLSLSLISETGQFVMGQDTDLLSLPSDRNELQFRYFHIPSGQSARNFHLQLKVAGKNVMRTNPIATISKPSKKSSSNRQTSLVIRSGELISLYNRINGQTVRTKHITVEPLKKQLEASLSNWSTLRIQRITQPADSIGQTVISPSTSIIYFGDRVILSYADDNEQISAGPFIIRRIDRNSIVPQAGPVCQLHRVAFEQLDDCGEPAGRLWSLSPDPCSSQLIFSKDYRSEEAEGNGCIRDCSCWNLVGVTESFVELTTLDSQPASNNQLKFPALPVDLPAIVKQPIVDWSANTLSIEGEGLFYSVWCGGVGPLLPIDGAIVDGRRLRLALPAKHLLVEHYKSQESTSSLSAVSTLPIWFAILSPDQGPISVYTGHGIEL